MTILPRGREHQQVADLVRIGEVTHRVVKDGAWSDPATWEGGRIPGAGAVVQVGHGFEVTYDVRSNASIFKLQVDGELRFATDRDTQLKIDTFLVTDDGKLEIGTAADPLLAHEAKIIFADNGSVNDLSWDPGQFSRGLISYGAVTMHGVDKTDHVKVAVDPTAGQNKLVLSAPPTNWQVGDKLVLTGTHYVPSTAKSFAGTEDEVVTIRSISGDVVTLEETLRFNHDTPAADLKASIANLSRNIVFSSENTGKVDHRGHVMFMHSDAVDVENAAFVGLGRTDKSVTLDDRHIMGGNGFSADPVPATVADNVRGRYPVHIHRGGGQCR